MNARMRFSIVYRIGTGECRLLQDQLENSVRSGSHQTAHLFLWLRGPERRRSYDVHG